MYQINQLKRQNSWMYALDDEDFKTKNNDNMALGYIFLDFYTQYNLMFIPVSPRHFQKLVHGQHFSDSLSISVVILSFFSKSTP